MTGMLCLNAQEQRAAAQEKRTISAQNAATSVVVTRISAVSVAHGSKLAGSYENDLLRIISKNDG